MGVAIGQCRSLTSAQFQAAAGAGMAASRWKKGQHNQNMNNLMRRRPHLRIARMPNNNNLRVVTAAVSLAISRNLGDFSENCRSQAKHNRNKFISTAPSSLPSRCPRPNQRPDQAASSSSESTRILECSARAETMWANGLANSRTETLPTSDYAMHSSLVDSLAIHSLTSRCDGDSKFSCI